MSEYEQFRAITLQHLEARMLQWRRRKFWRIGFDGDRLYVRTPWFYAEAAYEAEDFLTWTYWNGIRWGYKRVKHPAEGERLFQVNREIVFDRRPHRNYA